MNKGLCYLRMGNLEVAEDKFKASLQVLKDWIIDKSIDEVLISIHKNLGCVQMLRENTT